MMCWGNARHRQCERGEVIRIECALCANHLAGEEAAAEWDEIMLESRHNLSRVSLGRAAEYRTDAKFVAKIFPDMPRDKAGMDARIRAFKLPSAERAARWLTRGDVPAGEAGYLYLQAKLLAAGARGLSREMAINRWDEVEFAEPVNLRIESLDETRIRLGADIEGVSRATSRTWEQRAGGLMMRALAAAFSCEVGMKAILMTRNDTARKTHDLRTLYSDLPGDSRARLEADYALISDVVKESRAVFGKWRYFENSASMEEVVAGGLHHQRVGDLEKAARVIIDEGAMVGLEGELVPTARAVWTTELGEEPAVTDFRETMHFRAESGESAFVWPK